MINIEQRASESNSAIVFCDWENVRFPVESDNSLVDMKAYIEAVAKCLRNIINIKSVRKIIYGSFDMEFLGDAMLQAISAFKKSNYEIRNIPVKKCSGKDRSDTHIVMDMCEALFLRTCDHFILFSGDGDFSCIARKIKEFGKKITIIAIEGSCSTELMWYANEVILLPIEILSNRKIEPTDIDASKILQNNSSINNIPGNIDSFRELLIQLFVFFQDKPNGYLAVSYFRAEFLKKYESSADQFDQFLRRSEEEGWISIVQKNITGHENQLSSIEINSENPIIKSIMKKMN